MRIADADGGELGKSAPFWDQFGDQFGDDFLENSKTILNLNSKFFWKIPSPKKDMKKDMFLEIFLGGVPLLLLLLDFRV